MHAQSAEQPAFATTTTNLECPEQLIVWSIRHWLDGGKDGAAIEQVFWRACGITNVEAALQGFQEMIGILSSASRRTLYFHRPGCQRVSADELSILNLISALQDGRAELANALACWLVPASMEDRLLFSTRSLAAALHKSGNIFSPPDTTPLAAMAAAGTA